MLKVRWIGLCLLVVGSMPTSFAAENWQLITDNIQKSQRDDRQYRAISLDNKMTVLLVSDQQAVKSLAALALPVGSLQDPIQQQGLAHYLEHMVLMGSAKFPEPQAFSEFLSKHAGSYNASTAPYRTSYYFEVDNSAFEPALERLADAIAAPLFNPENADKERNAVNAELTMARSRDGMRIQQVDAETINQAHPSSKFFGGNLETLSDKTDSRLHDALLAFYDRYYSANLMVAVVYSNRSLDDLANLAAATFGQIKNHDAVVESIDVPAITPQENRQQIHYVPAKPFRALTLNFAIEDNTAAFASKTDEFIGYLIGNESENTLANWLKKQGLIESIYAGSSPRRYGNSGNFQISIDLTEKGEQQRDTVIAAVFSYLHLLRHQGIDARYYQEMSKVLDLAFLYPAINRNMSYVEDLSDAMLMFPVKNVLDAGALATHFDADAILQRLTQLTPDNLRVWLMSPNEPHNKEAYFVDAKYQIEPLANKKVEAWRDKTAEFNFQLPALNTYIPDDFSLINTKPAQVTKPQIALNTAGVSAFYLPSYYFSDEPKISLTALLANPKSLQTAKDTVLFTLMDYLANKSLDQLQYQAAVAGISFSSSAQNGLRIQASGFSQHLPELTQAVMTGYQQFPVTQALLDQAKSWYLQMLDESEKSKSFELALQPVQALSVVPYFERAERRQVVPSITVDTLLQYRDQFFKNATVSVIATGNISAEKTTDLAKNLYQQLGSKETQFADIKTVHIVKPLNALLTQLASSTDSALMQTFIPVEYNRIAAMARSQVLGKILHPWFFDQLRTKEQLGYALFSFPSLMGRQMGIGFLLQSNNQNPDYLQSRFDAFYQQAAEKLAQMSDAEFAQYQQGLLFELTKNPQTMNEELAHYLSDFAWRELRFDSVDRLMTEIKSLTKNEVLRFYHDAVIKPTGLSLSSRVIGQAHQVADIPADSTLKVFDKASDLQQLLLNMENGKP